MSTKFVLFWQINIENMLFTDNNLSTFMLYISQSTFLPSIMWLDSGDRHLGPFRSIYFMTKLLINFIICWHNSHKRACYEKLIYSNNYLLWLYSCQELLILGLYENFIDTKIPNDIRRFPIHSKSRLLLNKFTFHGSALHHARKVIK